VVGAVDQRRTDADHREARERTSAHDALDALLDTRNVFLRHRAADDLGLEDELFALRIRLEQNLDAGELAGAAGLLLVGVVLLVLAGDRLAIGHLRSADIGFDLELATHAVDDDVEVQFAHAGAEEGVRRKRPHLKATTGTRSQVT
jgi:hypothetical protein